MHYNIGIKRYVLILSQSLLVMLEYTKTILQKVSFSPSLFSKELKKSFKWLSKQETQALKAWCVLTFGDIYLDIIKDSFQTASI